MNVGIPPASLETASLATERQFYSGEDSGRVNKSSVAGYPTDTYTNPNDYIQQLSGNGYKIGTGIVLKVMAGDHVNIHVSSWYKTNGANPGTPVNPLNDLLAALYSGIGSTGATHGATATQLQSSGVLTPGATNFLNSRSYTSTIPKAYLNWVLFDDQFKMVTSGSGADPVGADQEFKTHVKNNLPITKNGYLYVFVSNETPNINVYFDNLQVTHIKGPLLQEQSYYPFGLEMAGISDQAMGKLDSKNKFNGGTELEEDYGVNLYSTFYRKYDPQIGRFSGVDCQSEASIRMSVYQFAGNNPVSLNDPLGDLTTAGLSDIINRLSVSANGGQWTSTDPNNLYEYGDEATGIILGGLAANGTPYDFSGGGGGLLPNNLWDNETIEKYRSYASKAFDAYYKYSGEKFTCEDFALNLLIYFAAANRLPVVIKNDTNPKGYRLENYDDPNDYFEQVASTTAARDLPGWGNVVETKTPSAGDLIVLFNGQGNAHHIQVITNVTDNAIYAAQGNFDPWYSDNV